MLLNKHNLNVARIANNGASRYTLNSILCTPEGTIATDGHRLVHVTAPQQNDANFPVVPNFEPSNGHTTRFLLSRDLALDIAKAIPRKTIIPVLANASVGVAPEGQTSIAVTDLDHPKVFTEARPEGTFPNWEMVVPKLDTGKGDEHTITIGFNADYLAELCQLASDFAGGRKATPIIKMTLRNASTAIRIDIDGGDEQHMTQVLMPIRLS